MELNKFIRINTNDTSSDFKDFLNSVLYDLVHDLWNKRKFRIDELEKARLTFEILNEYPDSIVMSAMWHNLCGMKISNETLEKILELYLESFSNEKLKSCSLASLFNDVLESEKFGENCLKILIDLSQNISSELKIKIADGLNYEACSHLDQNLKYEFENIASKT